MKAIISIIAAVSIINASALNADRIYNIFQHYQNKYQVYNIEDLNRLKSRTATGSQGSNTNRDPSDLVGNWEMQGAKMGLYVTVDSSQSVATPGSISGMEPADGGITISNDEISTVLNFMSIGDSSEVDTNAVSSMLFMNFDVFSLFAIIFGYDLGIENPMLMTVNVDSGYVDAVMLGDTTNIFEASYSSMIDTNHVFIDMDHLQFSFDNFVLENDSTEQSLNLNGAISPVMYQLEAGVENELMLPAMNMFDDSTEIYLNFYADGSGQDIESDEEYGYIEMDTSSLSWSATADSLYLTFYDDYYDDSSETDGYSYFLNGDTLTVSQSMDPCGDDEYYYYFDSYDECFENTELGSYAVGISGIQSVRQEMEWVFTSYDLVSAVTEEVLPQRHKLYPAYPNPFNPVTKLSYFLASSGFVDISIYDMMGRKIKALESGLKEAGYKTTQWNATNDLGQSVSAGVYLYKVQVDNMIETKKVVLLK